MAILPVRSKGFCCVSLVVIPSGRLKDYQRSGRLRWLQNDFEQAGLFAVKPVEPLSAFSKRGSSTDEGLGIKLARGKALETRRIFSTRSAGTVNGQLAGNGQ